MPSKYSTNDQTKNNIFWHVYRHIRSSCHQNLWQIFLALMGFDIILKPPLLSNDHYSIHPWAAWLKFFHINPSLTVLDRTSAKISVLILRSEMSAKRAERNLPNKSVNLNTPTALFSMTPLLVVGPVLVNDNDTSKSFINILNRAFRRLLQRWLYRLWPSLTHR